MEAELNSTQNTEEMVCYTDQNVKKKSCYEAIESFRPSYFVVEPINYCNIKCAACPWHTVMKRQKKVLSLEGFMFIFEKIKKDAKDITFYQMGEPLLNKDLFKMVRMSSEYGIKTNIATNGMLVGENIDSILSSGLSYIKIALDGIDKETHEKYRLGSDFDFIVQNIKKLNEERYRRGQKIPMIVIQTLVNRYNQGQLKELAEFAKQHGDKFVYKKMHFGRSKELISANKHFETGLEEFKRENVADQKKYYKNMEFCPQFNNMVILSNGHLVQCCFDFEGATSFGNILYGDYEKLLNCPSRKKFINDYFQRSNELCKRCDFIQDMETYQS
jgi:radical SAM protein with 4Fe4S-binding SPASM domain